MGECALLDAAARAHEQDVAADSWCASEATMAVWRTGKGHAHGLGLTVEAVDCTWDVPVLLKR